MAVRALEQEGACGPLVVDVYCRKDVVVQVNFQYHYVIIHTLNSLHYATYR